MCGICGIVGFDKQPVKAESIQSMMDSISHRGPDSQGHYISSDGATALGHLRLAIIDLSEKGHQPMTTGDEGRYWIVFNGEIYNFQESKASLENAGYKFASGSDTEVILHLYDKYGADCVHHMRGMFAFALWDDHRKEFFAARDRLGKKPFYYAQRDGKLYFASELKALVERLDGKLEIDPAAIDLFLTFGYIPAPFSIYHDVWKLPPAHRLTMSKDGLKIDRYWTLDYTEQPHPDEAKLTDQVEDLLRESVRLRLMSDVPLGALLSGGVDSSVVVALMAQEGGRPPKTFSVGFEESEYSELTHARTVAKHIGTEHYEQVLRPDVLELLNELVEHFDEPFADSSMIPTYLVSKHARQHITVALSGDGGDEIFGGYPRYLYETVTNTAMKVPGARLGASLASSLWADHWRGKLALRKMKHPEGRRYAERMAFFDSDVRGAFYQDQSAPWTHTADDFMLSHFMPDDVSAKWSPLARLQFLDTVVGYLPGDILTKVDIASMKVSLEMRSPLLDHKLAEFMAGVPAHYKIRGRVTKYLLKKIGERLVPAEILYRPKRGFSLPLPEWFRKDLRSYAESLLLSPEARLNRYLKPEKVRELLHDHIERGLDRSQMIFALLCLEMWLQQNKNIQEATRETSSLTPALSVR